MTLYVPMITPFDESGAVALAALETLARDTLTAGATGLVALGTTGEPHALTETERHDVIELLAAVCHQQNAPLVVGANTEQHLHDLAAHTAVTAALTLVPPFLRPGEEGVLAHFTAFAAISPVPLIAYHVPYRTGQPLSANALRRLAALPTITGIKLATGSIDADIVDLLADPPADFAILAGDDLFASPLLALGAHGGILASAHVETAAFAALIRAWQTGDVTTARTVGHRLSRLSAALFAEPNPTVIKATLHALGRIPTPAVRLPLQPATPVALSAALRSLPAYAS